MFFESVIVSLKLWFLKQKNNKALLSAAKRPKGLQSQSSIGVLIDLDTHDVGVVLKGLAQAFHVSPQEISVLGFSKESRMYKVPYYVLEDSFLWFGGSDHASVLKFTAKPYAYFLDFHQSEHPLVHWISLGVTAQLRIGFHANNKTSDFIVDAPLKDTQSLFRVLESYINKMVLKHE